MISISMCMSVEKCKAIKHFFQVESNFEFNILFINILT